ncbi:MAG: CotH kinase family protein [Bacteroidota bacterium]|nr:CotH kinase family protein [Bacteroidota bacterium]
MRVRAFVTISLLCFSLADAQDLYDPLVIWEFRLKFPQPDWRQLLAANAPLERDIPATLTVDGVTLDSVGVRYKGNSSFNIPGEKKPFNITVDAFLPRRSLGGYTTFNLNNCFKDPTFVREMIAYRLAADYLPSVKAAYVKLFINDEYWGLYLNVQQPNKSFLRQWFASDEGNLYKCDPRGDLTWAGPDTARYRANYELKTEDAPDGYADLMRFIETLCTTPPDRFSEAVQTVLDVDAALWYLVFCNLLVNLDSYIGSGHNYYFYHNPADGRFVFIPWDLNEVMGTFSQQLSLAERERLPVFYNMQAPNRPLISKLLTAPEFRERYLAHYRTMVREAFTRPYWMERIRLYQELIKADVAADTKKLYSMQAFFDNVEMNVQTGPGGPVAGIIPGILSLLDNRNAYLATVPELNRVAASISGTTAIPHAPREGDTLRVVTTVSGAARVFLRWSVGGAPFRKLEMKRESGVFLAEIPSCQAGTVVRFYIEAVTPDGTVSFDPERAERSTYAVTFLHRASNLPVVINEVMACNDSTIADPQGQYEDWIELYNTSGETTALGGCYLTDRFTNPRKWRFPDGTVIEGHGYLLVWADRDTTDTPGLHANFKIDKDGEALYLFDSDERGNGFLDSTGYFVSRCDTSWARRPNGRGPFTYSRPTPGADNDAPLGIDAETSPEPARLDVFPNPAPAGTIAIRTGQAERGRIRILDMLGRTVYETDIAGASPMHVLDISMLARGTYFIRYNAESRGGTSASALFVRY